MSLPCPCCSGLDYSQCCAIYLDNKAFPATAEKLMRSRYTAYTRSDMTYIEQTMSGKASLHFDKEEAAMWSQSVLWLDLAIIQSTEILVEFKARYLERQMIKVMHEMSAFERINNRWMYVDGQSVAAPTIQVSRNTPCPCRSGKKFKNCHGAD